MKSNPVLRTHWLDRPDEADNDGPMEVCATAEGGESAQSRTNTCEDSFEIVANPKSSLLQKNKRKLIEPKKVSSACKPNLGQINALVGHKSSRGLHYSLLMRPPISNSPSSIRKHFHLSHIYHTKEEHAAQPSMCPFCSRSLMSPPELSAAIPSTPNTPLPSKVGFRIPEPQAPMGLQLRGESPPSIFEHPLPLVLNDFGSSRRRQDEEIPEEEREAQGSRWADDQPSTECILVAGGSDTLGIRIPIIGGLEEAIQGPSGRIQDEECLVNHLEAEKEVQVRVLPIAPNTRSSFLQNDKKKQADPRKVSSACKPIFRHIDALLGHRLSRGRHYSLLTRPPIAKSPLGIKLYFHLSHMYHTKEERAAHPFMCPFCPWGSKSLTERNTVMSTTPCAPPPSTDGFRLPEPQAPKGLQLRSVSSLSTYDYPLPMFLNACSPARRRKDEDIPEEEGEAQGSKWAEDQPSTERGFVTGGSDSPGIRASVVRRLEEANLRSKGERDDKNVINQLDAEKDVEMRILSIAPNPQGSLPQKLESNLAKPRNFLRASTPNSRQILAVARHRPSTGRLYTSLRLSALDKTPSSIKLHSHHSNVFHARKAHADQQSTCLIPPCSSEFLSQWSKGTPIIQYPSLLRLSKDESSPTKPTAPAVLELLGESPPSTSDIPLPLFLNRSCSSRGRKDENIPEEEREAQGSMLAEDQPFTKCRLVAGGSDTPGIRIPIIRGLEEATLWPYGERGEEGVVIQHEAEKEVEVGTLPIVLQKKRKKQAEPRKISSACKPISQQNDALVGGWQSSRLTQPTLTKPPSRFKQPFNLSQIYHTRKEHAAQSSKFPFPSCSSKSLPERSTMTPITANTTPHSADGFSLPEPQAPMGLLMRGESIPSISEQPLPLVLNAFGSSRRRQDEDIPEEEREAQGSRWAEDQPSTERGLVVGGSDNPTIRISLRGLEETPMRSTEEQEEDGVVNQLDAWKDVEVRVLPIALSAQSSLLQKNKRKPAQPRKILRACKPISRQIHTVAPQVTSSRRIFTRQHQVELDDSRRGQDDDIPVEEWGAQGFRWPEDQPSTDRRVEAGGSDCSALLTAVIRGAEEAPLRTREVRDEEVSANQLKAEDGEEECNGAAPMVLDVPSTSSAANTFNSSPAPVRRNSGMIVAPDGRASGEPKKHHKNYESMTRERRMEANARQRMRVRNISAAFDTLRRAVPAYAHNQRLSQLSVLRTACAYIATLSRLVGNDYSAAQNAPNLAECVDLVTREIQTERMVRRRRNE